MRTGEREEANAKQRRTKGGAIVFSEFFPPAHSLAFPPSFVSPVYSLPRETVITPRDAALRASFNPALPDVSALSSSVPLPSVPPSAAASASARYPSSFDSPFSTASPPLARSPLFAYGPKYPYATQSNRINKKPPCVLSSPSAFPALLLALPPLNITAVNPAYVGQHVRLPVTPSADFFSLLTAPRLAAFFPPSTRIRRYLRGPGGIELRDDSQPYFALLRELSEARRRDDQGGDLECQKNDSEAPRPDEGRSRGRANEGPPHGGSSLFPERGEMRKPAHTAPRRGVETPDRRVWTEYADLLDFVKRREEGSASADLHAKNSDQTDERGNACAAGECTASERGRSGADTDEGALRGDAEREAREHPEYRVFFEEIAKISERKKQMYKGKKPWREDLHPTKSIFDQPCFPGDALPYIQQHNEEMIQTGKLDQVINEDELRCDALWADDEGRIVKLQANVHISEIRSAPNLAPVTRERQELMKKLPNPEPQWRFVVTTHLGYIEEKKLKVGDVPEMFSAKYMREIWNNHFALPKRGRQPLVLDDGSIVP
ncbi:conserved hypothetical protein [Neospora caninum Liverpool]|nr:conserved hypothetical protein [Neospora caninum Liverpool]CBZ54160.1 conserved hypothetical protein [Neospora caninum Liverpool]|eukprot:XP_003884191.1 conserved hypothetical protein [Neospora caninum Liverpool]